LAKVQANEQTAEIAHERAPSATPEGGGVAIGNLDDPRIVGASCAALDYLQGVLAPMHPGQDLRVAGDVNNAHGQRNRLTLRSLREAPSVPALKAKSQRVAGRVRDAKPGGQLVTDLAGRPEAERDSPPASGQRGEHVSLIHS